MRLFLGLVATLVIAGPADAFDPLQSEVKFVPHTSAGRNVGCGMEFTFVFNDLVSRAGEMSGISGSFSWLSRGGGFGGLFKIAGVDFDQQPPRQFQIHSGVLRIGGKAYQPDTTVQCEREQNFCGIYSMASSVAVFRAMVEKPTEVGFNRARGGLDIMLPMTASNDELMKLLVCMDELVSELNSAAGSTPPKTK